MKTNESALGAFASFIENDCLFIASKNDYELAAKVYNNANASKDEQLAATSIIYSYQMNKKTCSMDDINICKEAISHE